MGQFNRPGPYIIPEQGQVTVLQAYNVAGQAGPGGDPSRAIIIRRVNGKTVSIPVNIDQMIKKGDLSKDVAVLPDDIIAIPNRSEKHAFGINDIFAPISLLSVLGFRLFK